MNESRSIWVEITEGRIDPASVPRITDAPDGAPDGALVSFVGVVRASTDGKQVEQLEYEAYSEMAEKEMLRLAVEAKSRFRISSVAMIHRVGTLEVGDVSVAITVSAPHRGEAFDACEFLIDTVKQSVPIWKKEIFEDGTANWVNHP